MKISGKSIIYATFSMWHKNRRMPTNGNVEPFRDYVLSRKVARLTLIDQPVPDSSTVNPQVEVYDDKRSKPRLMRVSLWIKILLPFLKLSNKHGTRMVFKIRDFISVLDIGLRTRGKTDVFIGIEAINCIAGILLRSIGKVDKVVYYVLDYSPNRFANKLVNSFYIAMDRFCVALSDYVWDVSPEFQKIRMKYGLRSEFSKKATLVPIGLYKYQIKTKKKALNSNKPNLVFVGSLGSENGPDLAIRALELVLKKHPNTTLHIVGGGGDRLNRLKRLAMNLDLNNKVKFYGFIQSTRKMVDLISDFDIALAPYRERPGSIRYYADAAKIRTYSGAGLPVVTTPVPPLGSKLKKIGGALVVHDNPKAVAGAIDLILSDKKKYNEMRKAVLAFAKENTWNNEFDKAFSTMTIN